jgi:hypothetical protein
MAQAIFRVLYELMPECARRERELRKANTLIVLYSGSIGRCVGVYRCVPLLQQQPSRNAWLIERLVREYNRA